MKNRVLTSTMWIIAAFLVMLCLGLGFLHAKSHGVTFFEEKVHVLEKARSEDDFLQLKGSLYNDVIYLDEDVTLKKKDCLFSTEDRPFVGVFDGKGNTLILEGDFSESLFGYIGKGGVVKNVSIVVKDTGLGTMQENLIAILALKNEGEIENCSITIERASLSGTTTCGMVVAINSGTIENVYVRATVYDDGIDLVKSKIGAIAGQNLVRGNILNCIAEVEFVGFNSILVDKRFDLPVHVICGKNSGKIVNNLAIVPETHNQLELSAVTDKTITLFNAGNMQEYLAQGNTLDQFGFTEEYWKIDTTVRLKGE